MSRTKRIRIIIPVVIILFLGAFGRHEYLKHTTHVVGQLQRKDMDEISGIAASRINEDLYYVHNDSGIGRLF
jgi:hypothetical protein